MMWWMRDKAAKVIGLAGLLMLFIALGQIKIADDMFKKNNAMRKKR